MEVAKKQADDLPERTLRALKWNYLGNAARSASQLVISVVLARLLGPEVFGIVAVPSLMISLGMLVSDLGVGSAIVQRPQIIERDLRFLFTLQVSFGLLLTVVGWATAGPVASYFHKPEAAPIIRAMSLMFLLQSFGQTALAVLQRSLDFKSAQRINITSYLVAYVALGLPLAFLGCGPWSLVAAQLVQSGLSSALAVRFSRIPIRPTFQPASLGLVTFGGKVMGANLSCWGLSNLDSWVVGRVLGIVDLGIYGRAMALVASPTTAVTSAMQGVLFPACSRAQGDLGRAKRAYLGATMLMGAICMPVFVTVAAVPDTVIGGLLGPAWAPAAIVLVPLSLAMPVHAILAMVGPVLTAMDRVGTELRMDAVTVVVMVPLLYFTAQHSIAAVAWGILAIYVLRALLLVSSLLTLLEARWGEALGSIAWPAACAAATSAMTWGVDRLADRFVLHTSPHMRLLLDIGTAAVTLAIVARLLGRRILSGAHGSFLLVEGRLPVPVRRWLRV